MKKAFSLIIAIIFCLSANAQTFPLNLHVTLKKDFGPFSKGNQVVLTQISLEPVYWNSKKIEENQASTNIYISEVKNGLMAKEGSVFYCIKVKDIQIPLIEKKPEKIFDYQINTIQDLWDSNIINKVLYNLNDKGMQNSLRADIESDALEYIGQLRKNNLILNDPYLEYYLYSLVTKLVPENIIDGRPGNVNIVIVQDPTMNACMFLNGTMIINTGLLANIHTEDELIAIMAHEIAHFMLDHSVININKEISRQKRAEFWGALLTGITAGLEAYTASQNPYYIPGVATATVAAASRAIANEVNERLGMKYNHEQEYEADDVAVEMLRLLGYNPNALSSVFARMVGIQKQERMNLSYFDSYNHPALNKRIKKCGTPSLLLKNNTFEKYISFAVTSAGKMKFEDRRFKQALLLFYQNINNGVATSDDYLLCANCLLSLYNTKEKNTEVLQLVSKAKEIDPRNINVYKVEILGNLRAGNKNLAIDLLKQYIIDLTTIIDNSKWENEVSFAIVERRWADNMLSKMRGL